ncbi:hypothetical protein KFE25_002457 [Diacronema lutheri]|uniref:Uncharacterized protein n=1 Tax=Diacronema lutheri TaxID=2081491 RepID=A0A8J5X7S7_DIALT|nr:hypothetical protein KFE25_002457 [Diacronema lutheri]
MEEINYRQAGRSLNRGQILRTRTSGQLGRTHPAAPPPPSATIPSKYETVLFGPKKEREGFGSQASRFGGETVNDNPGPGTYAMHASTVLRDAPSIGKRGYGNGFASRTKRSSAPSAARTPGPGNYDVHTYRAVGSDVRAISRPFAQPKGGRALRPDGATDADEQTPGPGAYNLGRHLDSHSMRDGYAAPTIAGRVDAGDGHAGHRSVFASMAPRFANAAASDVRPGPGAYDASPTSGSLGARSGGGMPTSAFRSGVSRTSPRNAAARAPPPEEALGIHRAPGAGAGAGACAGARASHGAQGTPGPGHYSPPEANARAVIGGPSPAFRAGITDRFGRPTERLSRAAVDIPGPGAYDVRSAPDRQGKRTFAPAEEGAPISSSAFMSATRRERQSDGPRAPGPAYYKPSHRSTAEKRSFHFNALKRWTPA